MIRIVSNARLIAKKISFYVSKTPESIMGVLNQTAKNIQVRMNVPGAPVDYPLDWDSERQRKAFFASDGFGQGIPTKRQQPNPWTVSNPFSNEVDLFAPHPAGAVFGMPTANFWQSKIHRGRWIELRKVLSEELAKLPAQIIGSLKVLYS